jgi:purine nucleosidase
VERIAAIGTPVAEAMASLIHFYERFDEAKYGSEGAPLHDPCTIAYLLRPELFRLKPVHVAVETQGRYTMGTTVVDFWGVSGRQANALWAHAVDDQGFFDLLTERIARL